MISICREILVIYKQGRYLWKPIGLRGFEVNFARGREFLLIASLCEDGKI